MAVVCLIWIPVSQQAATGAHHVHHSGIWWNATQNFDHLIGHKSVLPKSFAEGFQLLCFWQFSIEDQIRDFFKRGMFGKFLDDVSAIESTAGDGANACFTGDNAFESRPIKGFGHS